MNNITSFKEANLPHIIIFKAIFYQQFKSHEVLLNADLLSNVIGLLLGAGFSCPLAVQTPFGPLVESLGHPHLQDA